MENPNIELLNELFDGCIKVLFVDLETREYIPLKVPQNELYKFDSLDKYWESFVDSDLIHIEDKPKIQSFIDSSNIGDSVIYRRKKDNSYIEVILKLLSFQGKCLLVVKDITDIYERESSIIINKIQRIDGTTGLLNAKAYKDDISKKLKGNVGVAFIDVNALKWVNDKEGHSKGNLVIYNIASLLKEHFPAYNVYRIGGDEFVVIGFNIKIRVFLHTAWSFHKKIWNDEATYTNTLGEKIPIASVGYSADTAEDILDIVEDAEKQMYEDKFIFYKKYPKYKR